LGRSFHQQGTVNKTFYKVILWLSVMVRVAAYLLNAGSSGYFC